MKEIFESFWDAFKEPLKEHKTQIFLAGIS